jgi:hypothetical protein
MRCSISRSPHSGATTKKLNVSCVALGSGTFIVRAVHLPPFDPEWIAGVIRSPSGYRAFRMDASYFIWQALNDENEKLPSIHAIYASGPLTKRPLSASPLYGAPFSARHKTTAKTRTSTAIVRFFISSSARHRESISQAGRHTCFVDHSGATEICLIAHRLYDYAARKPGSEAKLQDQIRRAERHLQVQRRSASNQALQSAAVR